MRLASLSLSTAACALALALWQTISLNQMRADLQSMRDSRHDIAQQRETNDYRSRSESEFTGTASGLTVSDQWAQNSTIQNIDLQNPDALALLAQRIAHLEARLDSGAGATGKSLASTAELEQAQQQAQKLTERMVSYGYMDAAMWQDANADLEAMTPEQNKVFWQQIFAAMEHNQIEAVDAN